jgi:UDPglucose--hexose-1-phosphate uridylyltransferase
MRAPPQTERAVSIDDPSLDPMADFNFSKNPQKRFNPLTQSWVLLSPHRTQRPWSGQVELVKPGSQLQYDPTCYMCPGNRRATGGSNPNYEEQFVFDNDFPAVYSPLAETSFEEGIFRAQSESGICRVVCYSPRHDLTFSRLGTRAIRGLVDVWVSEYEQLATIPEVRHVQIFENSGTMMGCSNPHPHGQIWATSSIPDEPAKEESSLLNYDRETGHCLLCDCVAQEERAGVRIVYRNETFLVIVPFWAIWPFETLVLPRRHLRAINQLSEKERSDLADGLAQITTRYDNLFGVPFPYSMGFHQSPTDGNPHREWHLHVHYYPPLLRSATIRKFMVGFELLGSPQRDLTPEQAAEALRSSSAGD